MTKGAIRRLFCIAGCDADDFMTAFDAVLFDCDGVLVDSESITNRMLCTMLNESGWAISQEECTRDFIGKTVRSQAAIIEAHTGKPRSGLGHDALLVARAASGHVHAIAPCFGSRTRLRSTSVP